MHWEETFRMNENEQGRLYHYEIYSIKFQFIAGYRYYYTCCRDGKVRPNKGTKRKTNEQRGHGNKKTIKKT